MTTNNISQKQILSYIVSTFHYWGITYISEQSIKNAKKNKSQASKDLKNLLFHLILLHMFNFKIQLSDYFSICNQKQSKHNKSQNQVKQTQIDDIILAYLSECQCPILSQMKIDKKQNNQQQEQTQLTQWVGCNLQSSRVLLLLCGWVMGVSDYFNQILPKLILRMQQKIQNPQKSMKVVNSLFQNKINSFLQKGQSTSSQSEQIIKLYKSIQNHRYQVQCLQQKQLKIKKKIDEKLIKYCKSNKIPTLTITDILSSSTKQQQDSIMRMQSQLKYIISNQLQNMNQRKYFWTWLQQRILKDWENELKQQNDKFQIKQSNFPVDLMEIDLNYLQQYIQTCRYYEQKYEQLTKKLQKMKIQIKRSKEVQNEIKYQFKQTLNSNKYKNNKKNLFIAIQLKDHMNISIEQKKIDIKKQIEKGGKYNNQEKRKLKKDLKKYLKQIQDAVKFI